MRPFKILSQGCLTSTLFLSIMIENQRLMKLFPALMLLGLIGAPAMAHSNHHSSHKHNHCHNHFGTGTYHCHKHSGNHHGRYHYHDGHNYKKHHNHKHHKNHRNHRNHYFVVPWLHIDIN